MNIQCIKCKGRNLCGRPFCPIQKKISAQKKVNLKAKEEYFGDAPNIFIGRFGYPNINVGILNTENYTEQDEPLLWSRENYQIPKIIDYRTEMINSTFKTSVKSFNDRMLDMSQEISLAHEPVDAEILPEKKPKFTINFNQDTKPHGPNVKLKKARIAENPKIPTKVDKLVSDVDYKASDAVNELYKKGYDEHYLTKILSVGNLGVKYQRKLVPTRWSITATDDMIAKNLINKVHDFEMINEYQTYFGSYLGNYYLILMFPEVWSYELFEMIVKESTAFSTDYESYEGRKNYASNTAGGYYSVRLAILERLKKMKRQASVLALRFITDEYWAPLGVWVTREAARNSVKNVPIKFSSKELMLKYVKSFIKKKFNYDVEGILNKSIMLKNINVQRKLWEFH